MRRIAWIILLLASDSFANGLQNINYWGYQLQRYDGESISRIENSQNTLWVIDYSRNGTFENRFSANQIQRFKANGNIVIAYFCLGEAEMARFYWEGMDRNFLISREDTETTVDYQDEYLNFYTLEGREILARDNNEFVDNFPVKFWEAGWQEIMIGNSRTIANSYLDQIIQAGFDGVYLDTVDAYEYYKESQIALRAQQMASFVERIAVKARQVSPEFKVFLQNGVSTVWFLNDPSADLYRHVDGFGIEDLFYPGEGEDNPWNFNMWGDYDSIEAIRQIRPEIRFFSIDYIPGLTSQHSRYFEEARARDFVPVIGDRLLAGTLVFPPN